MADPKKRTLRAPTGPILSKFLRSLALDIETTDDDGDPVTKAAALAALVWKYALGFTEVDVKTNTELKHEPDWRAVTLLFDRIEGKVISAPPEEIGHSLVEKVTEMGRARANSLAKAAAEDMEAGTEPNTENGE